MEEVYYALAELKGTVPAGHLSLLVTTSAAAWDSEGDRSGTLAVGELQDLLEERGTVRYYSSRYACAYLTSNEKDARWCGSWTKRPLQSGRSWQSSSASTNSATVI